MIGAEGQDCLALLYFCNDGDGPILLWGPLEKVGSRSEAGLVNVIYGLPRLNVNTGIYRGMIRGLES